MKPTEVAKTKSIDVAVKGSGRTSTRPRPCQWTSRLRHRQLEHTQLWLVVCSWAAARDSVHSFHRCLLNPFNFFLTVFQNCGWGDFSRNDLSCLELLWNQLLASAPKPIESILHISRPVINMYSAVKSHFERVEARVHGCPRSFVCTWSANESID